MNTQRNTTTTCNTKRGQTSQNGIDRLRRGTTLRSSPNDDCAVNHHDGPMTKALFAPQDPLNIDHQGTTLLKINVARFRDPNKENDIETAELQTRWYRLPSLAKRASESSGPSERVGWPPRLQAMCAMSLARPVSNLSTVPPEAKTVEASVAPKSDMGVSSKISDGSPNAVQSVAMAPAENRRRRDKPRGAGDEAS